LKLHAEVSAADLCVRLLAAHTEGMKLPAGQVLKLLPGDNPSGAIVCVIAHGRVMIEVAGQDVLALHAGSFFPESAARGVGKLRVISECELYRFRRYDLELAFSAACESGSDPPSWYDQYKLEEKRIKTQLERQVRSTLGVWAAKQEHPIGNLITSWSSHRREALAKRSTCSQAAWFMQPPEAKQQLARPMSRSGSRVRRYVMSSQCWWPHHWRSSSEIELLLARNDDQ